MKNVEWLWRLVSPKLPLIIAGVKEQKLNPNTKPEEIASRLSTSESTDSPISERMSFAPEGCTISPEDRELTFLCNSELQKAIVCFIAGAESSEVLSIYAGKPLRRDWLLLSGRQVQWAESMLRRQLPDVRKIALATLALGADRLSADWLSKLRTDAWSQEERALAAKVHVFLTEFGRDTSVRSLLKRNPSQVQIADLLTFPGPQDRSFDATAVIPVRVWVSEPLFGSEPYRCRWTLALYLQTAKEQPTSFFETAAELLDNYKEPDAALAYAQAGIARGVKSADLENTFGNLLSAKGEQRLAIEHYVKSLQLGRNDGWPEINTAKCFAELKQPIAAEEWFRKGVAKRSNARKSRRSCSVPQRVCVVPRHGAQR